MKLRSLACFAVSLLVAACVGFTGDPTRGPSADASPAPTPTPTPYDFSRFTPFPGATASCYDIVRDGAPILLLDVTAVDGIPIQVGPEIGTELSGAITADGSPAPLPDPGEPFVQDLGHVRGGVALSGTLRMSDDRPVAVRDVAISGFLDVPGASAPRSINVSVTGDSFSLTLPDLDAPATLTLQLTYRDDCYAFTAAATAKLVVGSRATIAACPTGEADLLAYLQDLRAAQHLSVAGRVVPMATDEGSWVWSGGDFASDSGTLFGSWDRSAPPIAGLNTRDS